MARKLEWRVPLSYWRWFLAVGNDNIVIRPRSSIWPRRPQQVLGFSASREPDRNMYGLSPRIRGGGSNVSMKTAAGLGALQQSIAFSLVEGGPIRRAPRQA